MKKQGKKPALFSGKSVIEGAGVRLKRVFGFDEVPLFDPFLMLDDFGSTNPEDYMAGFPWHPHRGIETVTYMLRGVVRHGDSLGNSGSIGDGQIQWMTAGSGIVHQEMPERSKGVFRGLQLWINLPARDKMMAPRYRDVGAADIPEVRTEDGVSVRVIAGRQGSARGPVRDIVTDPTYLDVTLEPGARFSRSFGGDHRAFVYALEGDGIAVGEGNPLPAGRLALFGLGDDVEILAGGRGLRFICVSGRPIGEPVAWRGPIVMNTPEELNRAFEEYRAGTFIKRGTQYSFT